MRQPLELSTRVALGHYVAGNSLLHQLDARAKLLVFVCLVIVSVVTGTILSQLALLLVTVSLYPLGSLSIRYALVTLRPALPTLLVVILLQLLFFGSSNTGSLGSATHVYFHWGIVRMTTASVHLVVLSLLRVVTLMLLITVLTQSTSSSLLTRAMESLLAPLRRLRVPVGELALVVTIALRFTPVFAEEAERLLKAQAARGSAAGTSRPWQVIQRTRSVLPLLVPLFLLALQRAEALAMAMEARGYRPGETRTSYVKLNWGTRETMATLLGLLCSAGLLWLGQVYLG